MLTFDLRFYPRTKTTCGAIGKVSQYWQAKFGGRGQQNQILNLC